MIDLAANPHFWRTRAEEARSVMRQIGDRQTCETLRQIADAYDRIAMRAATALGAPSAELADTKPTAPILVIDDDATVRNVVCSMLEGRGYETQPIEPTADLLSRLEAISFSLIITDIRMPHFSGWEIAAWARRYRPAVPVIALSGHLDMVDASGTRTLFEAVIAKPIRASSLLEEIEHALGRSPRAGDDRL